MFACIGSVDPLPLAITLQATPTSATTADSVTFVANAQGGQLLGFVTDYGDGSTEQYATAGARTATVTFRHRYLTAGTFQVTATVTDAVQGQKVATVQVSIQ